MAIGVGGWIRVFGTKCLRSLHRMLGANCGLSILPVAKFISTVTAEAHKDLRLSILGRAVVVPIPRFMLWSMGRDESFMYFSVQGIATILSSESIFAMPLQTASPSLPTRRMILMTSEHFSTTSVSDAVFRQKRIGSILPVMTDRNTRSATGSRMHFSATRNSAQSLRGMKN